MNGNKIWIYLFLIVSIGVFIFSLGRRYGLGSFWQRNNERQLTNIKIKDKAVDIGKVPVTNEAKTVFILYNTGKNNLYIDKIKVSCQCTAGEVTKEAIAPGDSVSILVRYNKKIEGYFFQDVLVYGNFETSPEILSFEGYLVAP